MGICVWCYIRSTLYHDNNTCDIKDKLGKRSTNVTIPIIIKCRKGAYNTLYGGDLKCGQALKVQSIMKLLGIKICR